MARGYCEAHYRHDLKTGDPISAFGYGERRKHPLYESWRWQARVKEGRVPEWDDFWLFVEEVGERPSEHHLGKRYRSTEPWGPSNFYWVERGVDEDRAAQMRTWRAKNKLRAKGYGLKSNYGINLAQYMEMYAAQNGKCALCRKPGQSFSSENGRSETLVVDHCHESSKRRLLLCPDCNKGLGAFHDSIPLLRKAIAYLKAHNDQESLL